MDNDPRFKYHICIEPIQVQDREEVLRKDFSYGASWKKRGGSGAYHVIARKMDRLEEIVSTKYNYDIFKAIEDDDSGADGSVLAEIRDLRRYLLLLEAEMAYRLDTNA